MSKPNILSGKAWRFGDDVDTDAIIPARYLNTSDPDELASHCMEDADPRFMAKMSPGDVMVGGKNFGCGSSREHAPIAIKAAGISCVIAGSFARIFYRNAFNMGLPIFESEGAARGIDTGDEVEVNPATGVIRNVTKGHQYQAEAYPPFMVDLIEAGGLIPYLLEGKHHGG
ncbi:MAG: 3-isopropylmalate dehydratase small subunit [bacterium]|nr:3-isopropylmalate dehydratase small subunit [bacterium]MDT8396097.1 3-isopropylmalate dehydratase small subunit [bacterium]